MDKLYDLLIDYKLHINSNEKIKKLLVGWEPCLAIKAQDTDRTYSVYFKNCEVGNIITNNRADENDHIINMESTEQELVEIFSGRKNPATSFLDGMLAIYADDKDQIKLDAISILLWGV